MCSHLSSLVEEEKHPQTQEKTTQKLEGKKIYRLEQKTYDIGTSPTVL